MPPSPINLAGEVELPFTEQWSPKIVARYEDFQFKLAKLEGDFVWHSHPESDEAFLVLEGTLRLDFRDGSVSLTKGEMLVVPRGVEHKPFAESECHVMVLVRAGTVNTARRSLERADNRPVSIVGLLEPWVAASVDSHARPQGDDMDGTA